MAKRSFSIANDTTAGEILTSLDDLSRFFQHNQNSLILNSNDLIDKTLSLIPVVTVIGDQSSGKSSFLSAVTGYELSYGTGTTTICRLEIRFRKTPESVTNVAILDEETNQINSFQLKDKNLKQFHDYIKSNTPKFNNQYKIIVTISGPDQKNITFVDLPGLIADDGTNAHEVIQIERMISEYASKSNCLIVHVVNSQSDPDTVISRKLIRQHDPENKRTITVYTKIDNINSSHESIIKSLAKIDPNGIFVWCRHPRTYNLVTEVEEYNFLKQHIPSSNYGRNIILEKVEFFTLELISINENMLRTTLHDLKNSIQKSKAKLGEVGTPEIIHMSWFNLLDRLLNKIGKGHHLEIQAKYNKLLNDIKISFPIEFPFQLNLEDVKFELDKIRGNSLVFTVGCESVVSYFTERAITEISNGGNKWFIDLNTFLDFTLHVTLISEGVLPSSREVGKILHNEIIKEISDLIDEVKENIYDHMTRTYTNPSLYDESSIAEAIYKYRQQSGINLFNIFNEIAENSNNPSFIQNKVKEGMMKVNETWSEQTMDKIRVEEVIIIIHTYWRKRMQSLQDIIYNRMNLVHGKIIELISNKVKRLSKENIKLLIEPIEITYQRELYQKALDLISNALNNIN